MNSSPHNPAESDDHRHSVLLVTKTLARGGAEMLLIGQARSLQRLGMRVEVLCDAEFDGPLRADLQGLGVTVHAVPRLHMAPGAIRRIAAPHCIVHTHSPLTAATVRVALPWRGSRPGLIHTEHNVWDRYHGLTRTINRVTYRRNDQAVAVSGVVRDSMSGAARERTQVLHHGIDLDAVSARGRAGKGRLRRLLGLTAETRVVGTIASLTPEKDYENLLQTARLILGECEDVVVVSIGTGPLLERMKRRSDELGLSHRVHFLGERGDAIELAADLDIFLLASRFEGLPVVLMEASALGLPIVATEAGGVPEIVIDDVTGRCVPRNRPDLLSGAVMQLLGDTSSAQRLAACARERSRRFSVDRTQQQLAEIYEAICPNQDGVPTETRPYGSAV